jgi:sulfopyruvate decarboxylase subunit beta
VINRQELARAFVASLTDQLVVTGIGNACNDVYAAGDRALNFYMRGSMGAGVPIAFGLARARPNDRVVCVEGDGSVLMNLGGLTTLARYRPRNLVHVVFDNESLLSVGGFPTATSTGSDIAAMAAAAGIPRTATVRTLDAFTREIDGAVTAADLTTIVAKVEAVGPSGYVTDLSLLENRFAFQRHLRRDRS